jgi:hypothetical protein
VIGGDASGNLKGEPSDDGAPMKPYVLLSVSLVLTSCSVVTGNGDGSADPGASAGYAEPPIEVDAGWVSPTPPDDAGTWPTPPDDAGTWPTPPDDAGTWPTPDDAGTWPTPPDDAGTWPTPPDDAGTWPTPVDAGACRHPHHGHCRR